MEDGEAELESSLCVVVPATLADVSDSGLDLVVHELTTGEAVLDLSQVVFGGHSVNESGDEVGSGHSESVLSSKHTFIC